MVAVVRSKSSASKPSSSTSRKTSPLPEAVEISESSEESASEFDSPPRFSVERLNNSLRLMKAKQKLHRDRFGRFARVSDDSTAADVRAADSKLSPPPADKHKSPKTNRSPKTPSSRSKQPESSAAASETQDTRSQVEKAIGLLHFPLLDGTQDSLKSTDSTMTDDGQEAIEKAIKLLQKQPTKSSFQGMKTRRKVNNQQKGVRFQRLPKNVFSYPKEMNTCEYIHQLKKSKKNSSKKAPRNSRKTIMKRESKDDLSGRKKPAKKVSSYAGKGAKNMKATPVCMCK